MKPTIIETEGGIFRADKILSVVLGEPDSLTRLNVTIHFMPDARDTLFFDERNEAVRFLDDIKQAMRKIPESALEEHEKEQPPTESVKQE